MKKIMSIVITTLVMFFAYGITASAEMDHSMHGGMKNAAPHGETIHQSMIDGFHLTYTLIDMREMMKKAGHTMSGHTMPTHHLMLMVQSSDSTPVKDAKVGFLLKNSDGSGSQEQVMAMAMGDGYGSDITLDKPGTYVIKVKAVSDGKKIVDEFNYTLKN